MVKAMTRQSITESYRIARGPRALSLLVNLLRCTSRLVTVEMIDAKY
jgi:hypothetical protein